MKNIFRKVSTFVMVFALILTSTIMLPSKASSEVVENNSKTSDADEVINTMSLDTPYYFEDTKAQDSSSGAQEINYDDSQDTSEDNAQDTSKSFSDALITLSQSTYTYSGSSCEPEVTVTINNETLYEYYDYEVSYSNNVNAGTAKVTVTLINSDYGTYGDYITKEFTIKQARLGKVTAYDMQYNGKVRNPAIYLLSNYEKLKLGKQYKIVTKKKIKKVGKYKIKIKGIGNYTGTRTVSFKIIPKMIKKVKTKRRGSSSITIKWGKSKGATGYRVQYYNSKGKLVSRYTKGHSMTIRCSKDSYNIYVYVSGYKTVKGKKIFSGSYYYRDAVRPKAPKFTISKGFGRYDVYMKHYGYYQIKYAFNKKMRGAYTYRGYGSVFYHYNLGSGTKVYIKIREYTYSAKGNVLMGPWSRVRRVTVY